MSLNRNGSIASSANVRGEQAWSAFCAAERKARDASDAALALDGLAREAAAARHFACAQRVRASYANASKELTPASPNSWSIGAGVLALGRLGLNGLIIEQVDM